MLHVCMYVHMFVNQGNFVYVYVLLGQIKARVDEGYALSDAESYDLFRRLA